MRIHERLWQWLVRVGFRLLYNELAWTYDVVSWLVSLGEWRRWQLAALPFVAGPRVLEIAHGPGHMLLALAQDGYEVAGLDVSETMGRLARRRLRRERVAPALARGKVQQLPFPRQSFDTVLSTFPTAFIAERATMVNVHRVLRPGGRFVIVPEGHLTGTSLLHRFIDWLFVITGQRQGTFAVDDERYWPEQSSLLRAFRKSMADLGFDLEVHHISLRRSAATVVVATRQFEQC
ncbi:MAG TPA: class I SAM-dependent methyltransferase [Candidatus Sulfomarinibacteraceae bacterium]|nr:class I SAM-dependent methyltransferase [Candidatus Sulfomarinibacteraceae bacterium]